LNTDILVVGGGPAGLAAAIAARQRGFRVTLADRVIPPIDKACGEGIMPDGINAARRLGIELEGEGGQPFRGIRFFHGERSVTSDFPAGVGLGVRRTTLHRMMVERAENVGVDLRWGARVTFQADKVALDDTAINACWIVGADGTRSAVRTWAGLNACSSDSHRFGFRRHYHVAPWSQFMELHWGDGCQIYITPVSPEEVCVVLISRNQYLRLDAALTQFPQLAARLGSAQAANQERGGITATRRLNAVYRGHVALVGDASGSVDAVTGEGLCLLFQHAVSLADAFAANDLSLYEAAHRRAGRRPRFMSALMLMIDCRTHLRSVVMETLANHPRLFAGMVRFHVGQPA
jgi:menaquinone-9 beta-reductase